MTTLTPKQTDSTSAMDEIIINPHRRNSLKESISNEDIPEFLPLGNFLKRRSMARRSDFSSFDALPHEDFCATHESGMSTGEEEHTKNDGSSRFSYEEVGVRNLTDECLDFASSQNVGRRRSSLTDNSRRPSFGLYRGDAFGIPYMPSI